MSLPYILKKACILPTNARARPHPVAMQPVSEHPSLALIVPISSRFVRSFVRSFVLSFFASPRSPPRPAPPPPAPLSSFLFPWPLITFREGARLERARAHLSLSLSLSSSPLAFHDDDDAAALARPVAPRRQNNRIYYDYCPHRFRGGGEKASPFGPGLWKREIRPSCDSTKYEKMVFGGVGFGWHAQRVCSMRLRA